MSTACSSNLQVNLQIIAGEPAVPGQSSWKAWVGAALCAAGRAEQGVVTVRLVSEDESATLNSSYRHQSGPTNVLAFAGAGVDDMAGEAELGDIVICLPVACREAEQQGKHAEAHLAHLVVHGTLHLVGYDHDNEGDAKNMESLETGIMGELGYDDPYGNSQTELKPANDNQ